jgi:phosphoserine phosphatase RsbU/P
VWRALKLALVFRKLGWLILDLLLLPVSAAPDVVIDARTRAEFLVRPKAEDWRCHTGDDVRWAQPNFDDHDWAACSSDALPPLGISWRRLHVRLPAAAAIPRSSIGTILPTAGVLYANGQEIASSGRVGAKPHYSTLAYRIVPLPRLPDTGAAELVFATRMQHSGMTRIVMTPRSVLQDSGLVDLELGSEPLLQQRQELYTFLRLAHNIPFSVVGLLALVLGAYVLRLWSAQRFQWEYFWFAAIAAFFNLRAAVHLIAIAVPMNAHLYQALENGFAPELLLAPFFWTLLHRRVPKAVAVYTASIFAVRLLGTLWVPTLTVLPWIWLATIPCMLLPVSITFEEARRGNREARGLAPTMLFYGAMIVWVNVAMACQAAVPLGAPAILGRLTAFPTWQLGVILLGGIEIAQTVFLLTTAVVLADRARRTSVEQAHLAGEIFAAQQVQQLLVPAPRITVGQYQIESAYLPSEQVGGDFFQLVPHEDGSLLIVVGDVSGKGLKAAMVVNLLVGALHHIRRETVQPASVLRSLNEVLYGRTEGGFVTCCCARVESTGEMKIANAGHLIPYRNGEEIALESGLPLGILLETHWPESNSILGNGDHLVFISDGVVEARDGHGKLLGFERVHALVGRGLTAQEIASAARQFGQQDDITVVEVHRTEELSLPAVAAVRP